MPLKIGDEVNVVFAFLAPFRTKLGRPGGRGRVVYCSLTLLGVQHGAGGSVNYYSNPERGFNPEDVRIEPVSDVELLSEAAECDA